MCSLATDLLSDEPTVSAHQLVNHSGFSGRSANEDCRSFCVEGRPWMLQAAKDSICVGQIVHQYLNIALELVNRSLMTFSRCFANFCCSLQLSIVIVYCFHSPLSMSAARWSLDLVSTDNDKPRSHLRSSQRQSCLTDFRISMVHGHSAIFAYHVHHAPNRSGHNSLMEL